MESLSGVYLLHFSHPVKYRWTDLYGDEQHYVGQSANVLERVSKHKRRNGAQMTKAAIDQGAEVTLAAIFPGEKLETEQLITRASPRRFCPFCEFDTKPLAENTKVAEDNRAGRQKVRDCVPCPVCGAGLGELCSSRNQHMVRSRLNHAERTKAYLES